MTLLEEAAAELRKAREANEKHAKSAAALAARYAADVDPGTAAEIGDRRMEIADGFTRLAAIEAGLPPCCCTGHREQETTS